jgi:hypothetical protein
MMHACLDAAALAGWSQRMLGAVYFHMPYPASHQHEQVRSSCGCLFEG